MVALERPACLREVRRSLLVEPFLLVESFLREESCLSVQPFQMPEVLLRQASLVVAPFRSVLVDRVQVVSWLVVQALLASPVVPGLLRASPELLAWLEQVLRLGLLESKILRRRSSQRFGRRHRHRVRTCLISLTAQARLVVPRAVQPFRASKAFRASRVVPVLEAVIEFQS